MNVALVYMDERHVVEVRRITQRHLWVHVGGMQRQYRLHDGRSSSGRDGKLLITDANTSFDVVLAHRGAKKLMERSLAKRLDTMNQSIEAREAAERKRAARHTASMRVARMAVDWANGKVSSPMLQEEAKKLEELL